MAQNQNNQSGKNQRDDDNKQGRQAQGSGSQQGKTGQARDEQGQFTEGKGRQSDDDNRKNR